MKRLALLLLCLLLPVVVSADFAAFSTSSTFPKSNASGGTTIHLLAKITGSGMVTALTTDTAIPLYLTMAGAGTSGSGTFLLAGPGRCVMDATNGSGVANFYVVASATTAGRCHATASPPVNGFVVGYMLDDATTSGTTAIVVAIPQPFIPGAGGAGTGTVNTGTAHRLAYYPLGGDGTTVDDSAAAPTPSGRYLKADGTDWVTSTVSAAGIGACTNQVATSLNADAAPTCTTITSAYVSNTIALTGTDIDTSSYVTGATGAFALKGDLTPTALSGSVNDYNPTALSGASILRMDGGAASRNITGLAGGADGRLIMWRNVGTTNTLVLKNESASSSASNRFAFGADVTLQPGTSFSMLYDSTTSRWTPAVNALLDPFAVRPCGFSIGDPGVNSPPLTTDNDSPDTCGNDYGADWKITSFACKTDAGSVTVTPIFTAGTATSIVTGAVTCTTAWSAGTLSGVPTMHSFAADGVTCGTPPCTLAGNLTTVDGTAKLVQFKFAGSLQK